MVFPQLALTPADVAFSCCGVRPLPYVPAGAAGAITRRHWLKEHPGLPMPMYSIVGGKLTTCRSLAEQAARQILAALGRTHTGDSRERPLPGALEYPLDEGERIQRIGAIAAECSVPLESVRHAWKLWGTRAGTVLAEARELDRTPLPDEPLPAGIVDWLVANELVARLEDLVERRLMLLYRPRITRRLLAGLAERLVRSGVAPAGSIDEQCDRVERRLGGHFGRQVEAPLAC